MQRWTQNGRGMKDAQNIAFTTQSEPELGKVLHKTTGSVGMSRAPAAPQCFKTESETGKLLMEVQMRGLYAKGIVRLVLGLDQCQKSANSAVTHTQFGQKESTSDHEELADHEKTDFRSAVGSLSYVASDTQTSSPKSTCSHSSWFHPPEEPCEVSNVWSEMLRECEILEPI